MGGADFWKSSKYHRCWDYLPRMLRSDINSHKSNYTFIRLLLIFAPFKSPMPLFASLLPFASLQFAPLLLPPPCTTSSSSSPPQPLPLFAHSLLLPAVLGLMESKTGNNCWLRWASELVAPHCSHSFQSRVSNHASHLTLCEKKWENRIAWETSHIRGHPQ